MAEPAAITYSAEQVEHLLRCPVCLDRFNNPKILPCQHTFCREPCLEGLCDMRTRKVRCPECRKEHYVPYSGAAGFPTNITVSNFLDLPAQASAREEQANGQAPQQEQVEGQPPVPVAGAANQCGVCEKEEPTVKCFHCNKLVCAACKHSHTGQMKSDVKRLVCQIRRGIPSVSNSISGIEQKSEQMKQQAEATKSEVRDTLDRYVKEMKDREKMLKSEIGTFLQGELRSLRLHQENLEVELASISSYCDSMDTLLNTADNEIPEADLVNMKTQCGEYIEKIRSTTSDPLPETRECSFRYDGQQLSSTIASFGGINIPVGSANTGASDRASNNSRSNSQNSTDASQGPPSRRPRWSDVEPIDTSFFRNFPASAVSPSPRSIPHLAPVREVRSSVQPSHSPNYSLPSRREDYMTRMDTSTDNILDEMDFLRMQEQITPRRGNTGSLFGADPFVSQRRNRAEDERIGGMFGGEGGGSEGRNGPSVTDGNTRGRRLGGRRQRHEVDNPWRNAPSPDPSWRSTFPSPGNQNRASNRNPAPNPELYNFRRPYDPRPAEAFDVTLDGEDINVQPLDRQDRRNRAVNGRGDGPSQRSGPSTSAAQSSGPRQARPRRNVTNGNSRQNQGHTSQGRQNQNNPSNTSSNTTNATSTNTASTPTATNSTSAPPEANNSNNQATNGNPETEAHEDDDPDRPAMIPRSNTFVRQAPSNSNNLPVVSSQATSFDVLLSDQANDNSQPSSNNRSPNPNDSIVVRRPQGDYKKKGRPIKIIGAGRGRDQGQFTWPRGVAVSPVNDSMLVADSSNHRVQIFDCNGHFVNSFGSYGHAQGEFDCLAGVAANREGEIIIADRYNHRIQMFDRYGTFLRTFGQEGSGDGQLNYPWGLCVGPDGLIYVCDKENHRVQVFQPNGTFVRKIGGLGVEPGKLENPHYCAVTTDNKLIVSDCNNHRVQIFSNTGQFLKTFGNGGTAIGNFKNPKGITVDRQGFIIVADSGNNRIQVFRGDGRFYCSFGSWGSGDGQFKGLEGVVLTSSGNIVVSDKENHRIQVF